MFDLPTNVKPGDRVVLEDGTAHHVKASYALSPEIWALELDGIQQIIQCDPTVKIRVQRNA
jgi:hypothetical protein